MKPQHLPLPTARREGRTSPANTLRAKQPLPRIVRLAHAVLRWLDRVLA